MARAVKTLVVALSVALALGVAVRSAHAQTDHEELAKQAANPGSSLTSVPFQHNYDCCFGPNQAHRYLLNIQPVIPFKLNDEWNLVTRTILPFVAIESTAPNVSSQVGFGDITQSFFFIPKIGGGLTVGFGPAFQYPIGDPGIGSQKWGAGPTFLLVKQEHGWTYGVLTNHIWSFAGSAHRDPVSNTLLQPFISHTWPNTTSITLNSEATYDWVHDQWTVPINLTVARIFTFGEQPVQLSLGGRYYAVRPENGPTWGARFTSTFLFPSK